ncbi:hypothetical protein [Streptomyces sp. NBC_01236]|uniref:hypothetical protein n=1 Tax=Streptomyces sp. NBC_01236 TaxID=2903789 RepID=UPI002E145FC1|nr:hypothetical protein OG324_15380 [Streptomyces sp. NBC_01236]
MANLMATATCTAYRAVIEGSGERVDQATLRARVGFLAELCQDLTVRLLAARWTETDLDTLAAGIDAQGE